jgi:hypothetical protein
MVGQSDRLGYTLPSEWHGTCWMGLDQRSVSYNVCKCGGVSPESLDSVWPPPERSTGRAWASCAPDAATSLHAHRYGDLDGTGGTVAHVRTDDGARRARRHTCRNQVTSVDRTYKVGVHYAIHPINPHKPAPGQHPHRRHPFDLR